jgi:hypothetical protein
MTTIGLERAAAVSSVIFANRIDDPLRTLSELVGEQIAMAGRSMAEVVPFKPSKVV